MSPRSLPSLLLAAAVAPALAGDGPILTEGNYGEIRGLVLPSAEESRWERIGWRASLWDAVVEAQETGKPILLWAMNGHPLACT